MRKKPFGTFFLILALLGLGCNYLTQPIVAPTATPHSPADVVPEVPESSDTVVVSYAFGAAELPDESEFVLAAEYVSPGVDNTALKNSWSQQAIKDLQLTMPLQGMQIQLTTDDGAVFSGETDASGKYVVVLPGYGYVLSIKGWKCAETYTWTDGEGENVYALGYILECHNQPQQQKPTT